MKKYQVEIAETLQRIIEVDADSQDDAVNIVRKMYKDEAVVLDSEDYMETEFSIKDWD